MNNWQKRLRFGSDDFTEGDMIACSMCRKQIDESEMTSRSNVLDILGVNDVDESPLDNLFRSFTSATQAWKCSRCGEWICNSCVCNTVIAQDAKQERADRVEHSSCGGMFRAPK
jgi:hypothetical protein